LPDVSLSLGDGSAGLLQASIATGTLALRGESAPGAGDGGVAATLDASLAAVLPGVAFGGDFTVAIDTTGADPADDFVRVTGTNVTLQVAGQTIGGNFTIERAAGPGGVPMLLLAITNGSLEIRAGPAPADPVLVALSGGQGLMQVRADGVAGILNGTVAITIPGFAQAGAVFRVAVNTTAEAVSGSLSLAGQTLAMNLPAGPYLRVEGIGVSVTLGGLTASGDFSFEQSAAVDGAPVTRLAVAKVAIGDGSNGLTNGEGGFVVTAAGVAGLLSGTIALQGGSAAVSGRMGFRLNTTGAAVDETIEVGGRALAIVFGAGETAPNFFQFFVAEASFKVGDFVSIEGSVSFGNRTLADGSAAEVFVGTGLTVFLGNGPALLADGSPNPTATGIMLSGAALGLVRFADGKLVLQASGSLFLLGPAGLALRGTATVRFNNSAKQLNDTFTIPGASGSLEMVFGAGETATATTSFTSFAGSGIELEAAGQTLRGDFAFAPLAGSGGQTLRVTAANVEMALGGEGSAVTLRDAGGDLMFSAAGLRGGLAGTVDVALPSVSFGSQFQLLVNTTNAIALGPFNLPGGVAVASIPAGPFLRLQATGTTLDVLGQSLAGDFAFERATSAAGEPVLRLAASNVQLFLGDRGELGNPLDDTGIRLANGSGSLLVGSSGLAGRFDGELSVDRHCGRRAFRQFRHRGQHRCRAGGRAHQLRRQHAGARPPGRAIPAGRRHGCRAGLRRPEPARRRRARVGPVGQRRARGAGRDQQRRGRFQHRWQRGGQPARRQRLAPARGLRARRAPRRCGCHHAPRSRAGRPVRI
jgi:hypothetical protein